MAMNYCCIICWGFVLCALVSEAFEDAQSHVKPPGMRPAPKLTYDFSACSLDISRHCVPVVQVTDLTLLQCLIDAGLQDNSLSPGCQQTLWNIKLNLTLDAQFLSIALKYCQNEFNQFPECRAVSPVDQQQNRAHILSCMAERKENMSAGQCRDFLTQIEMFVFTDFRLIGRFVTACKDDVVKLNCGQLSLSSDVRGEMHSQGATLDCLMRKLVEHPDQELISRQCRHEITRIAELQSDDFHLDRTLFFACRDDRERFCRDVWSGDGRVLQCLINHRTDRGMSSDCASALLLREQMIASDYHISHPLVRACQKEVEKYKCAPQGHSSDSVYYLLSYVLLCLENVLHLGTLITTAALMNNNSTVIVLFSLGIAVDRDCQAQIVEHRRMLMSDYRLAPELIITCARDLETYCKKEAADGSKALHCLMKASQMHPNEMNPSCIQAIVGVLKVADVSTNYKVDAVLYNDCKSIIENECQSDVSNEAEMLSCLMNHLDSPDLSEECENRILEIQYFLSRDFTLDGQLYDACHKDAVEKCHARKNWHETGVGSKGVMGPEPGYFVLTCLYRHAYDEDDVKLSASCLKEVRRVMRERSVSVRLMPEIADACFNDLAEKCSRKTGVDFQMVLHVFVVILLFFLFEELMCLQEMFVKLEPNCQDAVRKYTMMQSRDFRLNQALSKACRQVIKIYCLEFAHEEIDNGDMMDCLLEHKGVPEMNHKCRAYVSHTELISMKDYRFTFKFRQACRSDVEQYCTSKADNADKYSRSNVVHCLSEILIVRIMLGEGPELKKECRKQLRAEYLKLDNAERIIDPELLDVCEADISKNGCQAYETTMLVTECLKEHKLDLEPACRKYIFRKEKLEFNDNTFDGMLQRVCASEIRKLCSTVGHENVLHCLEGHKDDLTMSDDCAELVNKRQHEQASDIRLMPVLYSSCSKEIRELCKNEYTLLKSFPDEDIQGKVIGCLRQWLTENNSKMSDKCRIELKHVIYNTEIDPTLDIPFYTACKSELDRLCADGYATGVGGHRGILECIKARYAEGTVKDETCKQQILRVMKEELADIHLDVNLYQACAMDVRHYCDDVQSGDSKILSCLLSAAQSSNARLSDECRSKLQDRQLIWAKAIKERRDVRPPETVVEFAHFVAGSPARSSLLIALMMCLLIFFACGMLCGRITRRIRRDLKNR
ncbi:Golgi apparatus protein 1 -like protein [Trichinella spiralis]|uniref:Golgi apparatus protein 1-like protein n=1 Tax=Trichinella spiralis TaxID=6334 RepID=A0A0V1BIN9_TRISP|nr:Golgi apparatus protein 1 -like protein [Trichinella spiralis]